MKNIILVLVLSLSSFVQAKSLICQGHPGSHSGMSAIHTVEISSSNLVGDWLKDVVVQVSFESYDGLKTETGRAEQLDVDTKYSPRVYKNHMRFDLGHLTNTEDFSAFQPMDQCQMQMMIPLNADTQNQFAAPLIFNCDQGGGSITLECELN